MLGSNPQHLAAGRAPKRSPNVVMMLTTKISKILLPLPVSPGTSGQKCLRGENHWHGFQPSNLQELGSIEGERHVVVALESTNRRKYRNTPRELLDRTRRAWVAPARDGRYVLGQLRSRTAGVSLRSILDGIVKHYLNDQEIEKSRLFGGPGKSFLTSQNAVFFGTLKID